MSIEELVEAGEWNTVYEIIVSEQVSPHRVIELTYEYPDFAKWLRERGKT